MTKTLDLHGVKHEEAERLVENFILLNKPPMRVITGTSEKMRNIVEVICVEHKINYERWDWGEFKIF